MERWCILRTRARSTLSLAKSLDGAGFTVWTPIEHRLRRRGHSRERVEQPAPIMPTYVFAHAGRALALLSLAADPMKDHADFSVFHYRGRIPLIADHDLNVLRTVEDKDRLRRAREAWRRSRVEPLMAGIVVPMPRGPFAGLSGVVKESDQRYTIVAFGLFELKIDTFLLSPGAVDSVHSSWDTAA